MTCTFCNSRHVHKKLWIDGRTHAMCKACQYALYAQTIGDSEFDEQSARMSLSLRRQKYEAGVDSSTYRSYPA